MLLSIPISVIRFWHLWKYDLRLVRLNEALLSYWKCVTREDVKLVLIRWRSWTCYSHCQSKATKIFGRKQESYFKKSNHVCLDNIFVLSFFWGALFMDVILGAILQVLYCLVLFSVLFCGWKDKLYRSLLKMHFHPAFSISIPTPPIPLKRTIIWIQFRVWLIPVRAQAIWTRDFHVFIFVLNFILNTSYTYCAELHLTLVIEGGGQFLILTVCVSGI